MYIYSIQLIRRSVNGSLAKTRCHIRCKPGTIQTDHLSSISRLTTLFSVPYKYMVLINIGACISIKFLSIVGLNAGILLM